MNILPVFPSSLCSCNMSNHIFYKQNITSYVETNNKKLIVNNSSNKLLHLDVDSYSDFTQEIENRFPLFKSDLLSNIKEYGDILLGDAKDWFISEIWINVMNSGGMQPRHYHANSIVSGIYYVNLPENCMNTRFYKSLASPNFILQNEIKNYNDYNYQWVDVSVNEGSLILFPSNMEHSVPQSDYDGKRITVAFNALPTKIDSGCYSINLFP